MRRGVGSLTVRTPASRRAQAPAPSSTPPRLYRYLHRVPTSHSTLSLEQRAAVRAAGCRGWSFDAATAERAIKRLIEDHRTTPGFIEDMLRLRRKAGQRLDDAQAFERERERAFRQAERELRQFQRNLGRITDERRIARLEADLEELERAVEAARQAWLLARAQTHRPARSRATSANGSTSRSR